MAKSNATGWVSQKDHYAVPVLFNPYTGEPRDARDVQSDPQGILIVPPGKVSVLAATPSPQAAQQAPAKLVEAVTKAILFEDTGSSEGWEENTNLGEAAIRVCDARNPPRCSYCHSATGAPLAAAPAAPSTPASGGWMPIETAPRDGTRFLAAVRINCSDGTSLWERQSIYVDEESGIVFYDGGDDTGRELTDYRFWQPLPEAPTIEGESNG